MVAQQNRNSGFGCFICIPVRGWLQITGVQSTFILPLVHRTLTRCALHKPVVGIIDENEIFAIRRDLLRDHTFCHAGQFLLEPKQLVGIGVKNTQDAVSLGAAGCAKKTSTIALHMTHLPKLMLNKQKRFSATRPWQSRTQAIRRSAFPRGQKIK